MAEFADVFHKSFDGDFTLYARDYGAPKDKALTILMMHGLTRNSKDFHALALSLKDRYRVISVDVRGRGRSEYDPEYAHYQPPKYVLDMIALIKHLDLDKVALIGTSMGGIMAMLMANMYRYRVLGMVLNDIGPVLNAKGLTNIRSYVGKGLAMPDLHTAAQNIKNTHADAYPDFKDEDWHDFAFRTYRQDPDGDYVLDYDPNIALPFAATEEQADEDVEMWPLWEGLEGLPILSIRGEVSDLFSEETQNAMKARHKAFFGISVKNRGHAPLLTEPESLLAIEAFLEHLDTQEPS